MATFFNISVRGNGEFWGQQVERGKRATTLAPDQLAAVLESIEQQIQAGTARSQITHDDQFVNFSGGAWDCALSQVGSGKLAVSRTKSSAPTAKAKMIVVLDAGWAGRLVVSSGNIIACDGPEAADVIESIHTDDFGRTVCLWTSNPTNRTKGVFEVEYRETVPAAELCRQTVDVTVIDGMPALYVQRGPKRFTVQAALVRWVNDQPTLYHQAINLTAAAEQFISLIKGFSPVVAEVSI